MTTMTELYVNVAETTLAGGINSTATSLSLAPGTGSQFPTPGTNQFFRITLNDALTGLVYEVIWVTGRSGDTLTGLIRGQENTTATNWIAGDHVYEAPSAGAMGNLTQQFQTQSNALTYSNDSGSANAYVIAPSPVNLTTPVPGAILYFLAAHPNTSSCTIVVNGSSAYPLLGMNRSPLQGGEINQFCAITYDAALASYVLLWSTGGNVQVPTPGKSNHAVNLGYLQLNYALLNGNSSQPFSTSQLKTGSIAAPPNGTGSLLVNASGGVYLYNSSESALVPLYCGPGLGANQAVVLGQFPGNFSTSNGTQTIPSSVDSNGMVMKFGVGTSNSGGYASTNFATPFPTGWFVAVGNATAPTAIVCSITLTNLTTTNVTFRVLNTSGSPIPGVVISWIAFGY